MIDITDWLIDLTKEVDGVGAVYQSYPRKITKSDGTVVILTQTGRIPVQHAHGEETVTQLIYQVEVLAATQTLARGVGDAIANKYTLNNGEVTGWSVLYDETYQRYALSWSVSMTVDKRGTLYRSRGRVK